MGLLDTTSTMIERHHDMGDNSGPRRLFQDMSVGAIYLQFKDAVAMVLSDPSTGSNF